MSSENYHEPVERLSSETQDLHRAITSLIEELEAIDWYQQRAEACADTDLRDVLIHNRDEEVEHAMMVLEWLRRHHQVIDEQARVYLFTDGPITEAEDRAIGDGAAGSDAHGNSLRIGPLERQEGH